MGRRMTPTLPPPVTPRWVHPRGLTPNYGRDDNIVYNLLQEDLLSATGAPYGFAEAKIWLLRSDCSPRPAPPLLATASRGPGAL